MIQLHEKLTACISIKDLSSCVQIRDWLCHLLICFYNAIKSKSIHGVLQVLSEVFCGHNKWMRTLGNHSEDATMQHLLYCV
jgi:hypothetical protein